MRLKRNWTKRLLVGAVCIAASAAGAWSEVLAQAPGNELLIVSNGEIGGAFPTVVTAEGYDLDMGVSVIGYTNVTKPDGSTSGMVRWLGGVNAWEGGKIITFSLQNGDYQIDPGDINVPQALTANTVTSLSTTYSMPYTYYVEDWSTNVWTTYGETGQAVVGLDMVLQATAPPVQGNSNRFSVDRRTGEIFVNRSRGMSLLDNTGFATVTASFEATNTTPDGPFLAGYQTLADSVPVSGGFADNATNSTMEIIRP